MAFPSKYLQKLWPVIRNMDRQSSCHLLDFYVYVPSKPHRRDINVPAIANPKFSRDFVYTRIWCHSLYPVMLPYHAHDILSVFAFGCLPLGFSSLQRPSHNTQHIPVITAPASALTAHLSSYYSTWSSSQHIIILVTVSSLQVPRWRISEYCMQRGYVLYIVIISIAISTESLITFHA